MCGVGVAWYGQSSRSRKAQRPRKYSRGISTGERAREMRSAPICRQANLEMSHHVIYNARAGKAIGLMAAKISTRQMRGRSVQ